MTWCSIWSLSPTSISPPLHFPTTIIFLANAITSFLLFNSFPWFPTSCSIKAQILLSGYDALHGVTNMLFQFHFPLPTTTPRSKPQWTSHISFQNPMPLYILFSLPEMPFLPLLHTANFHSIFKNIKSSPPTQMQRMDFWTQQGKERVGRTEKVALTYIQDHV